MQPTNALIDKPPVTIENVFKVRLSFFIFSRRKIQPKARSVFHTFLPEQAGKRWAGANIDRLLICAEWLFVIPFVVGIECSNFKMKRRKSHLVKPAWNFQSTLKVAVFSTTNSSFITNCMMQKKMRISNEKCGDAQSMYLKENLNIKKEFKATSLIMFRLIRFDYCFFDAALKCRYLLLIILG